MTRGEWEAVLLDATERVRLKVSALAKREDRGRTAGVGAAGDRTIQADKEAEDELLAALRGFDGVKVLSEEAGSVGDARAGTLAVVDPVDGSANFERGIPFYCTAVAMVEGDSLEDVSLGVVRDLVSGDIYVAKKGGGATKNGHPVRTSEVTRTADAVVGIDLSRISPSAVVGLAGLVSGVRRQIHLGANALELCYLADGRLDAFVDLRGSIRITDFAAAYLIASEAGAIFTDKDGAELNPKLDLEHRLSFVASANEALHKEILELCRTPQSGEMTLH